MFAHHAESCFQSHARLGKRTFIKEPADQRDTMFGQQWLGLPELKRAYSSVR